MYLRGTKIIFEMILSNSVSSTRGTIFINQANPGTCLTLPLHCRSGLEFVVRLVKHVLEKTSVST